MDTSALSRDTFPPAMAMATCSRNFASRAGVSSARPFFLSSVGFGFSSCAVFGEVVVGETVELKEGPGTVDSVFVNKPSKFPAFA